jgi:lipopolysaccharide transport system permease protein
MTLPFVSIQQCSGSDPDRIQEFRPGASPLHFDLGELWRYRHLLRFLVARDLSLIYKQTLLGPLHLIIRPFVMTLLFQLVFNRLGGIPTDGVHPFLFYYSNQLVWAFFSGVFGSVYAFSIPCSASLWIWCDQ